MTIADDMQALVNQVSANTAAIAALQAQGGTSPPLPASGWPITPQQFDPLYGTAGHDNTASIAAAIAACPSGGAVRIPAPSSSLIPISNGFVINKPISIVGDGVGSLFTGSLPAGVDLFHAVVPANGIIRGINFKDFSVQLTSGGHAIHLDTTAANANMAEVNVSGVTMALAPNTHGIFIDNAATNLNGGTFNANFERNVIVVNGQTSAGIMISNGGDSIHIHGGIITGTGYAIISNQIGGAGNLVIDGSLNATANGGIAIMQGRKPIIKDIQMEFHVPLYTGAAINFAGSVGQIFGGTIGPLQMQILSTSGNLGEAVYINNASDVGIDGLELYSEIGGTGIAITGVAARTRVGIANAYTGFSTTVADASTTTQYAK